MYFANIFVSFLGPCMFYVNQTNILRHGSLNFTRKFVLFIRNLLFLLVRVLTIVSAIFIPVIIQWSMFVGNHGVDASSRLDDKGFSLEFDKFFSQNLNALTYKIRTNSGLFLFFVLLHFMLVASFALFRSPKFSKSMMREQVMHLVSSFWLPLPFLTIRGSTGARRRLSSGSL